MSDLITSTSDADFQKDVLDASMPVLVDFWAPWCGPCRALAPTLEEAAKEFEGRVKIIKLNVDDSPETPGKYSVRGIPSLILFKNGEVIANKVGALSKSQLIEFLKGNQ